MGDDPEWMSEEKPAEKEASATDAGKEAPEKPKVKGSRRKGGVSSSPRPLAITRRWWNIVGAFLTIPQLCMDTWAKLGLGQIDEFIYFPFRLKLDFFSYLFSLLVFTLDLSEDNFHAKMGEGNYQLLADTFVFAFVANAIILVLTRGQQMYAYINRPAEEEAKQKFHIIFEGFDDAYTQLTAFTFDAVAVFLVALVYSIGPSDDESTYTAVMVLSMLCSLPRAANGICYLFYLLGKAVLKYFEKANRIYEGKQQSCGALWGKFVLVLLPIAGLVVLMIIFTHEVVTVIIYFLMACGVLQCFLSVYTGLYPEYKEAGAAGFPLMWFKCLFGAVDVANARTTGATGTTATSPPAEGAADEKQIKKGSTRSIV